MAKEQNTKPATATEKPKLTPEQLEQQKKEAARKAYQEDQKKKMDAIVVGHKDINNNEITKILAKATEYVIYEIKTANISESVRTYIHTEQEEDEKGIIKRYDEIRSCIADAKRDMYKATDPVVYKARVGHLISQALSGNAADAKTKFGELIKEVNKEYREEFQYRIYYLLTALVFVLVCILISIYAYTSDAFLKIKHINEFIYVATAGSIGGFVSVSRRLKDTVFEREVKVYIFIIYAIERILVAIFASMIVLFAIKCNLAFGIINSKIQNPLYGYVVFAVVAGFSETFLPNLLIKLVSILLESEPPILNKLSHYSDESEPPNVKRISGRFCSN